MAYTLLYWPGLPGRAEPIRLAFVATGTAFSNVTAVPELQRCLADAEGATGTSFAVPVLKHGDVVLGQTPAILSYLGPRLGLAPKPEEDPAGAARVLQLFCTVADFISEIHDTHHPIDVSKTYEDQHTEAAARAAQFRNARLPKFLGFFDAVLRDNAPYLTGATLTYADLALFFVVEGLRYAFPRAMSRVEAGTPHVSRCHSAVAALPRISAYWHGPDRVPFGNGIFRKYAELDDST